VAKQLLILSGVDSSAKPGSVAVNFRLNQSEIAQLVGGSRQHVNRVIVTLEQDGAITRQGPRIVAVRPDLLAAATEQGVR
jgi:DNA-binding GntR family transcriptional regulator